MIKKAGILTFHASHNYGSMLQAYALQSYIRSLGVDVEEINLRIDTQKKLYPNPLRFWGPRSIIARLMHPKIEFGNIRKWYLFERFLKKHIHYTKKEYHSWEEILEDIPSLGYDAIICGGDQIWNIRCIDFDKSYYLPSDLGGIKKLSYSPSMGGFMNELDDLETKEFVKRHLNSFDFISVRDYSGKQFLTDLLGKDIAIAADPTILLTVAEWEKIIPREPIIEGEYILYYSPFTSKKKESLALLFAADDCRVVSTNGVLATDKRIKCYNGCGPIEFLNIFKHAKFVCGNSYHLVVFSLLFHKEFVAINGETDSRIRGLLSLCGLEERGISPDSTHIPSLDPIDFSKTDELLDRMRRSGISLLHEFINNY